MIHVFPEPAMRSGHGIMKTQVALPEGYLLHHYRLAKVLGVGGFSIVYLAVDTPQPPARGRQGVHAVEPGHAPRRHTTVEALTGESTATFRVGIKRFFEEAAALAKIRHPNIVRVTDFFRDNNTVYMVMHYESGKDLRAYIKRHSRLSEKFIRTIFPELLEGLKALHAHGLLHLDGEAGEHLFAPRRPAMLLDFGAAQAAMTEKKAQPADAHPGLRAARTARPGPPGSMERSLRPRRLDMGVHERQGAAALADARRKRHAQTRSQAIRTSLLKAVARDRGYLSAAGPARTPAKRGQAARGVRTLPDSLDADSFINRLLPWRKRAS